MVTTFLLLISMPSDREWKRKWNSLRLAPWVGWRGEGGVSGWRRGRRNKTRRLKGAEEGGGGGGCGVTG